MNEHERETTTIIYLYLDGWEITKVLRGGIVRRMQGRRTPHANEPSYKPERVVVPTVFHRAFDEVLEP